MISWIKSLFKKKEPIEEMVCEGCGSKDVFIACPDHCIKCHYKTMFTEYKEDYSNLSKIGFRLKRDDGAWVEYIYTDKDFVMEVIHDYIGAWSIVINGQTQKKTASFGEEITNDVKYYLRKYRLEKVCKLVE